MTLVLENLGSLITVAGTDQCLGYLWHIPEHGTFDSFHGKVDVTEEHAKIHNQLLDEDLLKGLDDNCEIGQGYSFYTAKHNGKPAIKTFIGTLVSDKVSIAGRVLTFHRAGKTYRGRTSQRHDLFNFRRVR